MSMRKERRETRNESDKGFTLVETMVAIAVVAIALVGPFVAVQNALRASYTSRDQLIASQLAQEGMEYVRSVRDANFLNNRAGGWLDGFNTATQNRNRCFSLTSTNPTGYCTVDPMGGDLHQSAASMVGYLTLASVPVLDITPAGFYRHAATSPDSKFKRSVQIATLSADEIRVTVVVSWITTGQTYSVTVVGNLQNWQ